ncbi:MAG: hypothetical protein AAF593_13730 [Planctomycetota bacterium]
MKSTVLFLALLIGAVAWFTYEPVREELAAPIDVMTNAAVGVAEASALAGPAVSDESSRPERPED